MLRSRAVLVCLMLAFGVSVANAQKIGKEEGESARSGFWFTVGLGGGSLGFDCVGCSDERETGISGNLALGGTLSPSILIGVGTNGWYKQEDVLGVSATLSAGWFTAQLVVYPSKTSGFHFRVGLGGMFTSLEIGGVGEITSQGPGGLLGAGYDLMVGSSLALTPYINFLAAQGNLEVDGIEVLDENFNPNLAQFGVALTIP